MSQVVLLAALSLVAMFALPWPVCAVGCLGLAAAAVASLPVRRS